MLVARDYNDNEYPLLAVKVVNSELNGQEDIELTIHQQSNNSLDLKTIDKLWELDYNNITYKIVYVKQQTRGSSFYLNVRATPLFYWEFDKSIIHEDNDGSHTANSAFRTVFEGTNYNFVLVDFSPSVEIEGFGKGSTRLELFKRLLDRYNYEFTINGSTVTMRHLVGNDTNFMYKYKLNASNVSRSTDATAMFTHIKGFGNFEEGEEDYFNNAQLKREFTSPLADIVGKWEGPPIVDGRMTQQSTLDSAMQEAVEDSLEISVEGTLHDIRQMGYDIAVPVKGDRVWLLDERINLEQEIRVYSVKTTYDERDNIIDCEVTFGSQSIRDRHKANINSLSKNFQDLLTGKLKLPVISLEKIGMDMINAIHAASSEIIFGDFGMQAISKTNPNHVFGLNSEGWYISQDGGRTPRTIATAQGIYADAIFAGTLWLTNDMNIQSADGFLNITGSSMDFYSDASIRFNSESGGVRRIRNGTSSVLNFPLSRDYDSPMVGIGVVNQTGGINLNHDSFRGIRIHGQDVPHPNDLIGNQWDFVNPAGYAEGSISFYMTGSTKAIAPQYSAGNTYNLGTGNNGWDDLYLNNNILVPDVMTIQNKFNGNQGLRVSTVYEGRSRIAITGVSAGQNSYYDLGTADDQFSNIYLFYQPVVSSDARLKEDIHHNDLGLDFIKDVETKGFKLINNNKSLESEKSQYGLLAQQLERTLIKHGVDLEDVNMVSTSEKGYKSIQYTQLIAPLIKSIQELSNEVEALKNAERADDAE